MQPAPQTLLDRNRLTDRVACNARATQQAGDPSHPDYAERKALAVLAAEARAGLERTATSGALNDAARALSLQPRQVQITSLYELDRAKPFRQSFDSKPGPASVEWEWIQDGFADRFECHPDQVNCIETEDGDRITVKGEIVGRVEHKLVTVGAIAAEIGRAA